MEFKINDKKNFFIVGAFLILFAWGVNHFATIVGGGALIIGILAPFILGCAIAFVLNVPMKIFEKLISKVIKKKSISRALSMLLAVALAGGIIIFVLITVIPEMINTIILLNESIPVFLDNLNVWLKDLIQNNPEITAMIASVELNWEKIMEQALAVLQSGVTNILSSTVGVATSVIGLVTTVTLGVIFSLYILGQKEKLGVQAKKALYAFMPVKAADRTLVIGKLSHKTFSGFIAGQCTEALVFGILCYIGMVLFQFPYAISISVLIGFTTLIPVLGAFLGTAVGAVLILVTNPIEAVWFVVFIIVLQQIDENLIYPRIVGSSVGLPGIWVMIAVIMGGSLMGVLGMLIFVPLVSVLYSLFRETVYKRLKKKEVPADRYLVSVPEEKTADKKKSK